MSEGMLEAKDLWKIHSRGPATTEVLRGVDLRVERGEMIAILGPSGAGKTTLLNVLSGMDRPTRGEVRIGGQLLNGMGEKKRSAVLNRTVGFVFQFYHLIEDLTVLENVMLPALLFRSQARAKVHTRARGILTEVGLEAYGGRFPSELSGGERQRVAIARSVMNEPEILFCDEPTGNLDSETGRVIQRYLQELAHRHHKTVLIVTHDDKIAQEAGRVLKLKDGKWLS